MISATTTLYHVTPARNLRSILELGLKPTIGRRSQEFGETLPVIYLFRSREMADDAIANWLGEQFSERTKLALLEVVVPDDHLTDNEFGQFERVCRHPIPTTAITILTRNA